MYLHSIRRVHALIWPYSARAVEAKERAEAVESFNDVLESGVSTGIFSHDGRRRSFDQ